MSLDNAYGRMLANQVQKINERKVKNMGAEDLNTVVMEGSGYYNSRMPQSARPLSSAISDNELSKRVIGGAKLKRNLYAWDDNKKSTMGPAKMIDYPDRSSLDVSALNSGSGMLSDIVGSFGLGDMEGGAMAFGKMKKKAGRPKKQTQKDKEDERLAMEIHNLKMREMPSMDGGAMAFGKMKKKAKSGSGFLSDTLGAFGLGKNEGKRLLTGPEMKGSSMSGMGKVDGRKKRAEIVRKVMADKGLSMIEASKFVKAHNLY
jgi:hypothetical protein